MRLPLPDRDSHACAGVVLNCISDGGVARASIYQNAVAGIVGNYVRFAGIRAADDVIHRIHCADVV